MAGPGVCRYEFRENFYLFPGFVSILHIPHIAHAGRACLVCNSVPKHNVPVPRSGVTASHRTIPTQNISGLFLVLQNGEPDARLRGSFILLLMTSLVTSTSCRQASCTPSLPHLGANIRKDKYKYLPLPALSAVFSLLFFSFSISTDSQCLKRI